MIQGILQVFPQKTNSGRIYSEKLFQEQLKNYEMKMKMNNRKRKIESILSNLK